MNTTSSSLSFFISLSRIETGLSRRMDAKLGGLGWSDFLILHALSVAPDGRMRRVDLADAIGLREAVERAEEYFADIIHPSESSEVEHASLFMRKITNRIS